MIQANIKWIGMAVALLFGTIAAIIIGYKHRPLDLGDKIVAVLVGLLLSFVAFLALGIITQMVVIFIPSYNKSMLDYEISQMTAIEKQIETETDVDQRDWLLNQHYKYHKRANGYRRLLGGENTNLKTFEPQNWKYQEYQEAE